MADKSLVVQYGYILKVCPILEPVEIDLKEEIYQYLRKSGGSLSSAQICKRFFEDKLNGNPHRHVCKILKGDPRFTLNSEIWGVREFSGPDPFLKDLRYCVFDLETTGGVPPLHRIIEIGAVIVCNGEIVEEFQSFVNPRRPLPDYVKRLTGIRESNLKNAPSLEEVLKSFLEFAKGCVLVAHNASFDVNFVSYELFRCFSICLQTDNICTLRLAKYVVADSPSHKLDVLCRFLGVPLVDRHRALGDARATGLVFVKLLKKLKEKTGIETLSKIRKFCVEPVQNHFPQTLGSPEFLESLPQAPGLVWFKDEQGRRIYVVGGRDIQKEMKTLFYENPSDTSFFKKAVRKSRSVEQQSLFSYLQVQMELVRFFATRKSRDHFFSPPSLFIKFKSARVREILLVQRRITDGYDYAGPFVSTAEFLQLAGGEFVQAEFDESEYPPGSKILGRYKLKNQSIGSFLKKYSIFPASFMNIVACVFEEGEARFLFIREGYLVKSRKIPAQKLEKQVVIDMIREVLRAYYLDKNLAELLGKTAGAKSEEMCVFMRWFMEDRQLDQNITWALFADSKQICESHEELESVFSRLCSEASLTV